MKIPPQIAPLTRAAAREIDRRAAAEFGIPTLLLMENAGRGCVATLQRLGVTGPVAICCHKGNNGGDGLVIARHLDGLGIPVRIVLLCTPAEFAGDAATNWQIVEKSKLPFEILATSPEEVTARLPSLLAGAEWIVDALLGTGASGDPKPPLAAAIEVMNAAPGRRLAIDLPSGLDCDTGLPGRPTIRADHTCTFVAPKVGMLAESAREYVGKIETLPLGIPQGIIQATA